MPLPDIVASTRAWFGPPGLNASLSRRPLDDADEAPPERGYWLRREVWPLYAFFGGCAFISVLSIIEAVLRDNPLLMILDLPLVGLGVWALYRLTTRLGPPRSH